MSAADSIRAREDRMRERSRPAPTRHELASMTKSELVAMAEARGIKSSGTKADIIDRLAG